MPLLRSATIDQHQANDVARVRGLIDSLKFSIETITTDIAAEERRSQVSDTADINYSTLARSLRDRRDNLEATIGLLHVTLARFSA